MCEDSCLQHFCSGFMPEYFQPGTQQGLYISPDAACKGKGAVLVGVDTTLVQVPDINLYAGMVLGSDELVCPGAAPARALESLE